MIKVNFITNLSLSERSGGGTAVNAATFHQLQRFFTVNYAGPVSVKPDRLQHLSSRMLRLLSGKGPYFFFSDERLKRLSAAVSGKLNGQEGHCNFFHGFTSWIGYESSLPYFAYADACFAAYIRIYNNPNRFLTKDIKRICDLERKWLGLARGVFFRSQWALEDTRRFYGMEGAHFRVAGLGGFIDMPAQDTYAGGRNILFISREFVPKGGIECFAAYKLVRGSFPETTLTIIGDKPPANILTYPGVHWAGLLRKNVPSEYQRLQDYFASAFVLVHPTVKDTNPLVLTEAGYFGCPPLASRSFAIPELILDGETGYLLPTPVDPADIASRIIVLFQDQEKYLKMRKAVRQHTTGNFTWDRVGDRFYRDISQWMEA